MIWETNCLDFSRRLGAMSSANILLDTSIAKTTSTPSLFTVSSLVPILGLTSAKLIQAKARQTTANFSQDLKLERSGLNLSSNRLSANLRCRTRFHNCKEKYSSSSAGMAMSK